MHTYLCSYYLEREYRDDAMLEKLKAMTANLNLN